MSPHTTARPFLERRPGAAIIALFALWLAAGILEGLGF